MSIGPINNFLSTDNINQTFNIIDTEIKKQSNGISIANIPKYKNSFPKMANIIFKKCQSNNEILSLSSFNTKLIHNSIPTFLKNLVKDGYIKSINSSPDNYMPAQKVISSQNTNIYSKSLTPNIIHKFQQPLNSDDINALNSDFIYQNVNDLELRDKIDPMEYLNQYNNQREQDIIMNKSIQQQSTDNILSVNDIRNINSTYNPIITPNQSIYIKKLVDNKLHDISSDIVADNKIPYNDSSLSNKIALDMQQIQRDTQPKYIEKIHYITVNSVDREWDILAENRYQFQVKFNQKYDPNNRQPGTQITQIFRNILSVEMVMAIMPFDTYIETFDTRLYFNISKNPYLLLKIDELDRVFNGTNSANEGAFSMLIYDKTFFTEVLSSSYATNIAPGIVNSIPALNFANEFKRGYIKYQPVYFEKKKFYNNPLASLSKMSIHITDHRGSDFNTQNDVLAITTIEMTLNLDVLIPTDYEINPQFGFPYTAIGNTKMIKINTTNYFSNRLFRIGDRILIRNHTRSSASNSIEFTNFINRNEGHIIVNLDVETDTSTANKSYIRNIYIAPPGIFNVASGTVSGYYDSNLGSSSSGGVLVNSELQCNLMFRIVTRDVDTSIITQPINV